MYPATLERPQSSSLPLHCWRFGLWLFGRGQWSRRRATTAIRQLAQRAASKASIVNFSLTMTEQAVGGLEGGHTQHSMRRAYGLFQ